MDIKDEKYWIAQVLAGNMSAYEPLVSQYQDMVFTLALRILKHSEDAQEVAQDVFVKAYRSLHSFQQKAQFKTWLYRITYNESINALNKRTKRIHLADLDKVIHQGFEDQNLNFETDDEKLIILKALDVLNETERAIVTLYYYDDVPIKDIASITHMTQANVKIKLFRSRQKLYEILKDFDFSMIQPS